MNIRPLNVGYVGGGGGGAFIVHAHQTAILMTGARPVCGALHEKPDIALQSAADWYPPIRGYPDYDAMFAGEANLPAGERMDYVLIVTPNSVHFDPARKALEARVPVFCEKPLTLTVAQAKELADLVKKLGIPFGVAHTYTGHWTSRLARHIARSGLLGDILRVDSYYDQGWLASRLESMPAEGGHQQAKWRTDPAMAGASCCGGDIGTHAYMQARYVTGLEIIRILFAKLTTFVEGRPLDDDFITVCELSNGGVATICASQVKIGHLNDLGIKVYGRKASLRWRQEDSENLTICLPGKPDFTYHRGNVKPNDGFLGDLPDWLLPESTLPAGHNEAFPNAFARLHGCFQHDVRRWQNGEPPIFAGERYPSVEDGLSHMKFIEAAVKRSQMGLQAVVLE